MDTGVVALIILVAALAGLVIFLLWQLLRQPVQQSQPRGRPTTDPTALRQERIEAARRRTAEVEAQAAYEETLLFLEEDAEYYRKQTNETREARRQRRQSPKGS